MNILYKAACKTKLFLYKRKFRSLGHIFVFFSASFTNPHRITIGDGTVIRERVWLAALQHSNGIGDISVGNDVHIARDVILSSAYKLTIGVGVTLGPRSMVMDNNHSFDEYDVSVMQQGIFGEEVVIGDFSWVGAHAIILPGVTIGKGAVVAAGAVVTKNVSPYTIVGGVPAKFIRKRCTNDVTACAQNGHKK